MRGALHNNWLSWPRLEGRGGPVAAPWFETPRTLASDELHARAGAAPHHEAGRDQGTRLYNGPKLGGGMRRREAAS